MSEKSMSILGVGPLFAAASGLLAALVFYAQGRAPELFALPDVIPRAVQIGLGVALLALGLPLFAWSIVVLKRGFPEGRLFTCGPYALCRHPLYACWVVFNVPGLFLLSGGWLGLLLPIPLYVVLRALVRSEEAWLEETFGDEYRAYKARTPAVLPKPWGRSVCG